MAEKTDDVTREKRRKAFERLSRIRAKAGRKGGKSRSEKKKLAALANLEKANQTTR